MNQRLRTHGVARFHMLAMSGMIGLASGAWLSAILLWIAERIEAEGTLVDVFVVAVGLSLPVLAMVRADTMGVEVRDGTLKVRDLWWREDIAIESIVAIDHRQAKARMVGRFVFLGGSKREFLACNAEELVVVLGWPTTYVPQPSPRRMRHFPWYQVAPNPDRS